MENKYKTLTFGKIKIDVKNTEHGRKEIARMMWDKLFKIEQDGTVKAPEFYNKKVNKIGAYLLNRKFSIILKENTFFGAIKEWFIRHVILNANFINWSLNEDYDKFHDWLTFETQGMYLEDIKKKSEVEEMGLMMYNELLEKGYTFEQCKELFLISLRELVGKLNT